MDNLSNLQQQSAQMQQALQQQEVVSEMNGVKVIMRGDQYVREVLIDGQSFPKVAEAFNDAIGKTQMLAAQAVVQLGQK